MNADGDSASAGPRVLDALREADARYRDLVERVPAIVYSMHGDGSDRMVYMSPQIFSILGYTSEQWLGQSQLWVERLHPDDRERVLAVFASDRSAADPEPIEYRMLAADGRVVWLRDESATIPADGDRPALIQGVAVDVTDRKQAEEALRAEQRRFQAILDGAPFTIQVKDLEGRYVLVNRHLTQNLGRDAADVLGKTPHELYPAETADSIRANDLEVLATRVPLEREEVGLGVDGTRVYLAVKFPLLDAEGEPYGVCGISTDVTERKRTEVAVQRLAAIVESSDDAIIGEELDGTITAWNPAAERLYGYTAEEAIGRAISVLVPEDRADEVQDILARIAQGEQISSFQTVRVRSDGERIDVSVTISPIEDSAGRVIGASSIARDNRERKLAEQALTRQAMHDALTGLPNRTLLLNRLYAAVHAAKREQRPLALLLLDLDRFKEVNDTLGHHAGDLLLQTMALRLKAAMRGSDTIARLGGDEFAVLLPQADTAGLDKAQRRLLHALAEPFMLDGHPVRVGASVGAALFPAHAQDAETLLRHADVAMYQAKRAGGGFTIYAPDHDIHRAERLSLEHDLRAAVAQGALLLHYQPKVDCRSGKLTGVEALVRWPHPQRGLVPPGEFIPLAEQIGLIGALSDWVLRAALKQCRAWQDRGLNVPVAVNLSMRNLHDARLPRSVAGLLRRWGVPANRLTVEVTETAVMADPAQTREVLTRLRALGVQVSVDDFGTGYSSLAHLRHLPVDELKLDRSFVQDLMHTEGGKPIVRAVLELGHALGLRIVAEGVEDLATWERLVEMGCDVGQGYFLGRPASAEDLDSRLSANTLAE